MNHHLRPTSLFVSAISLLLATSAMAFPPTPYHELYGVVRDQFGNPLSQSAVVILNGPEGKIVEGYVSGSHSPGANYSLKVPLDAGTIDQLYQVNAITAQTQFTIEVRIGATVYFPIEMAGTLPEIGEAGKRTRLDLTLGVDSDGDGLPDSWEQDVIDSDPNDDLMTLADVTPDGDPDSDGVPNLQEYIAGTYAFEGRDSLELEIVSLDGGVAELEFLAITGRTYQLEASPRLGQFAPTAFALTPEGPEGLMWLMKLMPLPITLLVIPKYMPNPSSTSMRLLKLTFPHLNPISMGLSLRIRHGRFPNLRRL